MKPIVKIIFSDNIRSKIVIAYFAMLALLSWTTLLLEDSQAKGTLTMLNLLLFVVPLVSLLYTTVYLSGAGEFVVLLLSQPLRRSQIWHALFGGVAGSLAIAFVLGAGVPAALFLPPATALLVVAAGVAITLIFTALAFLASALTADKTRGIGVALLLWLFLTMIYDAVLLYVIMAFPDYPIEKPVTFLLMLNPLDMVRFQVILQMDMSAMMGYSVAAFKAFLGATLGSVVSVLLMLLWVVVPYLLSLRVFKRKDL